MAPIYESDVAAERWSKAEWNHYELWEKVEQRLRRYRRFWIFGTVLVFLGLSSVPIVIEQRPHWMTMAASRRLAQEVNWIKRQAGIDQSAYRIRFRGDGSLAYLVERVSTCDAAQGQVVISRNLVHENPAAKPGSLPEYVLLNKEKGAELGIPALLSQVCYDPWKGSDLSAHGEELAAFGIIPAKDLALGRLDRMTTLLVNGVSAEVTF